MAATEGSSREHTQSKSSMPCTARVCMPQTMVLVCFPKSVVALAKLTRRQRESSHSWKQKYTSQARDEGQAQENSRNGDGNKQSRDITHSEERDTGGRENNFTTANSFKRKVIFLFVDAVCLHQAYGSVFLPMHYNLGTTRLVLVLLLHLTQYNYTHICKCNQTILKVHFFCSPHTAKKDTFGVLKWNHWLCGRRFGIGDTLFEVRLKTLSILTILTTLGSAQDLCSCLRYTTGNLV